MHELLIVSRPGFRTMFPSSITIVPPLRAWLHMSFFLSSSRVYSQVRRVNDAQPLIGVAIVPLSLYSSGYSRHITSIVSPLSVSTASRTTNEQPSDTDSYSGLLIYPSANRSRISPRKRASQGCISVWCRRAFAASEVRHAFVCEP